MNSRLNKQIEPVCRFGPGGDFISVWPLEPSQPSPNRLAKLLTSIAEVIITLLGSEIDTVSAVPTDTQATTDRILTEKGCLEYAVRDSKADKPAYPTPATIIKSNRRFWGEPMLFADDWGIGLRTGHKPKYHIRAYRRTAKKRPAFSLSSQGLLFETKFKSARIA